jgi:MFS family permease
MNSSANPSGSSAAGRNLWIACVLGLCHMVFVTMTQPLVALQTRALGWGPAGAGFALSSFGLLPLLLSLPGGVLVDRVGPRRVLTGTLLGTAVSLGILGASRGLWGICGAEALLGTFHMMSLLALQSWVAQGVTGVRRDTAFGYLAAATSAGQLLGPAVGGLAADWFLGRLGVETQSYRATFLLSAALAVASVALARPILGARARPATPASPASPATPASPASPATPATPAPRQTVMPRPEVIRELLALPGMGLVASGTFVTVSVMACRLSFHPLFLKDAGHSAAVIGAVVSLQALTMLIVRPLLGVITPLVGRERLLVGCMIVYPLTWLLVPVSGSLSYQALNTLVAGLAVGVSQPVCLSIIATVCREEHLGTGMALRWLFNRLAVVTAPVVTGLLAGGAGLVGSICIGGGGLLAVAAGAAFLTRSAKRGPER